MQYNIFPAVRRSLELQDLDVPENDIDALELWISRQEPIDLYRIGAARADLDSSPRNAGFRRAYAETISEILSREGI